MPFCDKITVIRNVNATPPTRRIARLCQFWPKTRGAQFVGVVGVSRPIHVFGLGLDGQRWRFGERDLGEGDSG